MDSLNFIKDEMLTHIPICTHKEPKRVLVISDSDKIQDELNKYSDIEPIDRVDTIRTKNPLESFNSLEPKSYDVAIVDSRDFGADREFWIELTKLLTNQGVVSSLMSNLISDELKAKEELETLGAIYKIVMPYRYEEPNSLKCEFMLLASRFYHPTADINLQRADLTDGFRYYNSDIAIASFSMPTFIFKNYLGIIKR